MTTKYCPSCKQEVNINLFSKNKSKKDGLASSCKNCQSNYQHSWYLVNKKEHIKRAGIRRNKIVNENRQYIFDYLSKNSCKDCGETNPIVLEFDHVKGKKIKPVSEMISFSRNSLNKEISKCEIRCANCHRKKTARDFGWYENVIKTLRKH